MNVLVYDAPVTVAHFVKSVLRAQCHRVAVSDDPADALLKLATPLFDAIVIGPAGAPEEVANLLEREWPGMPVVLAGAAVSPPAMGQLAGTLVAPLSAERLVAVFRRLERRRAERLAELPVEVLADGLSIACRLADLTPESMVLAGESDEFHRWLGGAPRRVVASILGAPVGGEAAAPGPADVRRVRRVDVRLDGAGAREVFAKLLRPASA